MPYKVQFVGLVCFYRQSGARLALLPDGETPPSGVDPHHASIIVAPEAIELKSGWSEDADTERGIFWLPMCTISIEGADTPGTLDTSGHDGLLPQLRQIDPNFEIDPELAQTSARLTIRQGTLSARKIAGGSAAVSQLEVAHDGTITVTVSPTNGPARTLRLAAGTEIMIGNMSKGGPFDPETVQGEENHFRIYEKLSVNPVTLSAPTTIGSLPEMDTLHWLFVEQSPINLHIACSNTGCC